MLIFPHQKDKNNIKKCYAANKAFINYQVWFRRQNIITTNSVRSSNIL